MFQNVFMHLTYHVIDERKIDRITPAAREKIDLGPKPPPWPCPVMRQKEVNLENAGGNTGKRFIHESVTRCRRNNNWLMK